MLQNISVVISAKTMRDIVEPRAEVLADHEAVVKVSVQMQRKRYRSRAYRGWAQNSATRCGSESPSNSSVCAQRHSPS